jgi:uncharacterized protein
MDGMKMQEHLKTILSIQELDIQMIRLMRLKRERQVELDQINTLHKELVEQLNEREEEIVTISDEIVRFEKKAEEIKERTKKLEDRQASVKKIEEFNALTKELSECEREKSATENALSNLVDKRVHEEGIHEQTKLSLDETAQNSKSIEADILETIRSINTEGAQLEEQRSVIALTAEPNILNIYERLIRNKKDRVVVPIENRICNGCHITLTAQHENLVRRAEKTVFCEHCSRVHYWDEQDSPESGEAAPRRRRRRTATKTT